MSDRLSAVLHERLAPAVALDVERRLRARWAGARVWMTWPAATGKFDRGRPSGAAQQLANDVRAALADAGAPGDVRAHDVLLPFAGGYLLL